jgi:hypothetical protein
MENRYFEAREREAAQDHIKWRNLILSTLSFQALLQSDGLLCNIAIHPMYFPPLYHNLFTDA